MNSITPLSLILVVSLAVLLPPGEATANPLVEHVVLISVDGLRGDLLQGLLASSPELYPNFQRFVLEGAATHNARTDFNYTVTLPNHTTQLTGRPVLGAGGHNVTFNEDNGGTLEQLNGTYIAGVFDVVHDSGRSTGFYATKDKFNFLDRSWNAAGVPSSKIDRFVNHPGDSGAMIADFISDMNAAPHDFSFLHFYDPDSAGHTFGWGSSEWNSVVAGVDSALGAIFDLADNHAALRNNTAIVLTADHGGLGTGHSSSSNPFHYTIPFYAWGEGVTAGADLYLLNSSTRKDPGAGRPGYSASLQPIRNGDAANLALDLAGLGPVPGSIINASQDLAVDGTPVDPPHTITFRQGLAGYAGTRDTYLQEDPLFANSDNGGAGTLGVDDDNPSGSGRDVQPLLWFEGIFGSGPTRIPANAEIVSATLRLQVTNPGDLMQMHRMLVDWDESSTWNSLEVGVQVDGGEAAATSDTSQRMTATGIWPIDVTASLEAWLADPQSNLGWVFRPTGADGVDFSSSEGAAPPELVVRFYASSILGDLDCDGDVDFDDIASFVLGLGDPQSYEDLFGVSPATKGDMDGDGDLDFDDIAGFVGLLSPGRQQQVPEPSAWALAAAAGLAMALRAAGGVPRGHTMQGVGPQGSGC